MYIDIHSHFLYGVDDGPETLDTSLRMLRFAASSGVKAAVATPHVLNNQSPQWIDTVISHFHETVRAVITERLDIELFLGAELFFQYGLDNLIDWPIGSYRGMGAYFLVETPMNQYPRHFAPVLSKLRSAGKRPVFAHPERITPLVGDVNTITALVSDGILIQVTSGSLLGEFGRKVSSFTWELLERNLVHAVASDAHDVSDRPFNLAAASAAVTDRFGEETADRLFFHNPRRILFGEEVVLP